VFLLNKHGVAVNYNKDPGGMIRIPPRATPKGKSKLRKWTCGCTNLRVAVPELEARCLRCGNRFEPVA